MVRQGHGAPARGISRTHRSRASGLPTRATCCPSHRPRCDPVAGSDVVLPHPVLHHDRCHLRGHFLQERIPSLGDVQGDSDQARAPQLIETIFQPRVREVGRAFEGVEVRRLAVPLAPVDRQEDVDVDLDAEPPWFVRPRTGSSQLPRRGRSSALSCSRRRDPSPVWGTYGYRRNVPFFPPPTSRSRGG